MTSCETKGALFTNSGIEIGNLCNEDGDSLFTKSVTKKKKRKK